MNSNSALGVRAKILAVLVRDARQADGRTLKECGEILGITAGAFAMFESGKRSPSLPELEVLAYFFDLPLSHFWGDQAISEQGNGRRNLNVAAVVQLRQRIISARLRQLRTEARLTIKQLAEKAGLPPGRVSVYERGTRAIPLPELEALAWALNVPVESFLERQGPIGQWEATRRAVERFAHLPPDLRDFIIQPTNESYLRLAMRLSELKVDRLRGIAEDLLDITY